MLETSHPPIGPCGPLGPWPCGDNSRHASTVLLSSVLDSGKKAGRWRIGVMPVCRGKTAVLSFKFWDIYNGSTSRSILYEAVFGFGVGRDWGYTVAHAPALQEFGDMLARSKRNRVQSRDGTLVCVFGALLELLVSLCARAYQCMSNQPACAATLQCSHAVLRTRDRNYTAVIVTAFHNSV